MGGTKVDAGYELNADQVDWIKEMVEKYELEDQNKALRVVLDFVMSEADEGSVFEDIRCNHC